MTPPKIPKAGQSKHSLHTLTVTNPKGKTYSYRGRRLGFWLTEDELKIVEKVFNYVKATGFRDFTDRERETIQKFSKAVIIKYCRRMRERYVEMTGHEL